MAKPPLFDDSRFERGRAAWFAASTQEREEALRVATRVLDELPWKGERATAHQSLEWPRKGVRRDDGAPITGVPPEVKEALSFLAGAFLAGDPLDAGTLAPVFLALGHLLQ
jgi:hypothetical protein